MHKRLRVLLLVFLALALLSACANPAYTLYGAWRSTDPANPITLDFKQDGHVLETSQGITQNALFELTGDNLATIVIKPTKDTAAQATSLTYLVQGSTLSLLAAGQTQPMVFTRLK